MRGSETTSAQTLSLPAKATETRLRGSTRAVPNWGGRAWRIVQSLWLPAVVLGAWEALVALNVLDALFFPPPRTLLAATRRLIESGELGAQLGMTLTRTAAGFAIGFAAGLIAGVLMGTVGAVRRCLEPVVSALYTTPKMSLLPMVMLLFGVGNTSRILLISLGCFIMLTIHTFDAVRGVNQRYLELAASYGAGRLMLLRKVYIPAGLPQVFTGMRLSAGRALMVTIAIELVSCPDGIGSMIWMAWQTFATEKLYIGVILSAALGMTLHRSLRWLERRLIPWKAAV
jgi:NitT/TauT family transport system permease protein